MKLRDLVANSLPRVRGRKKKTPASANPPASNLESAAKFEVASCLSNLDKNQGRLHSTGSRSVSRDEGLELQGIAETSWRGNALYRGLESARAVKFNSRLMSASYTSSHGMVTSHSAEGFSSHMMLMSRSYEPSMTVPDCNESCPQMCSISETCTEPFSSPQQYYHCHYHKHNHHHYHHHHVHPKPMMTPFAENNQKVSPEVCETKHSGNDTTKPEVKSEPGFFRKSFASFGGIRRHSNKSKRDLNENRDTAHCTVCPYPEEGGSSEKKVTEKRSNKHRRKNLKGLSVLKENIQTAIASGNKDSVLSSDTRHSYGPTVASADHNKSIFDSFEKSNVRERSVESCSSRLYGSREGSSVRDNDFTAFDSASLSGYESDLPRCKVHRSRSRIKTNPWLPSPQPPADTRGQQCELRESTENVDVLEEPCIRFSRSMSFESQRNKEMIFPSSKQNVYDQDKLINQRPRSLTPKNNKMCLSLGRDETSTSGVETPQCGRINLLYGDASEVKNLVNTKWDNFNNLNNDRPKCRSMSTVSPNSEFVMLADNLEQLANNISFEYEEILDCTLESISIGQEDGQSSIHELLTDEENGNVAKPVLKSDIDINNAHSPDSGIGGLGSTDGDEVSSHNVSTQQSHIAPEHLPSLVQTVENTHGADSNFDMLILNETQNLQRESSITGSTHLRNESFNTNRVILSQNSREHKTSNRITEHICASDKSLEDDRSAMIIESNIDNTSCTQIGNPSFHCMGTRKCLVSTVCHNEEDLGNCEVKQHDFLTPLSRMDTRESCGKRPTLMVNERLDIEFQPCHRKMHGSGIIMGTGSAVHEKTFRDFPKQGSSTICGSSGVLSRRNARPCVLKSNPRIQKFTHSMNDMEKSSSQDQDRRSWSSEFDFPRNITITENMESPTENWRWDDQFPMSSSQHYLPFDQKEGSQQSSRNVLTNETNESENTCFINEELIVKLNVCDTHISRYQRKSKQATEMTVSDVLEAGSSGMHSMMNDASVQTDFDDDFAKWCDADTLESLEEKALDPAESTRIWLLTGNMQGSADTGYSSMTRDSLILLDEDSLFLAGELEERAAAERLSYSESSNNCTSIKNTPSESVCPNVDSHTSISCVNKCSLLREETECDPLINQDHTHVFPDGKVVLTFPENEALSVKPQHKCLPTQDKMLNWRIAPHNPAPQNIASTDCQFQTYRSCCSSAKRSSSDSSDQTLKSSDSDDLEHSVLHRKTVKFSNKKDSETGETKICMTARSGEILFAGNEFTNSTPNLLRKPNIQNWIQSSNPNYIHEADLSRNIDTIKTFPDTQSSLFHDELSSSGDSNLFSLTPEQVDGSSDRADYLEFLKDAPLNRSHLKRPLFLVPGLGPVDMSCSEQINLFAESTTPATNLMPYSSISNAPVAPTMSPSTAHCGKKLKYKKGDNSIFPDREHSDKQFNNGQHSHSVCSSILHAKHTILHSDNSAYSLPEIEQSMIISPSSVSGCSNDGILPNMMHTEDSRCVNTNQISQKLPVLTQESVTTGINMANASEKCKRKDERSKSLREKVMSLRREKEAVFQKIQEARQDEKFRQDHRLKMQGTMQVQRKDALLETLRELKNRIEEQSKLLKQSEGSSGDL